MVLFQFQVSNSKRSPDTVLVSTADYMTRLVVAIVAVRNCHDAVVFLEEDWNSQVQPGTVLVSAGIVS